MSKKPRPKLHGRHSRESGNPVPSTPNEDNTPDEWETTTFRAVCLRAKQWNPSKEPREHFEYIDVSAVSRESCEIEQPQRTAAKTASSRARKIVHAGDCLFATIRPRLLRVAHVGPKYQDQIASTAFCVLRPNPEKAVSRFLYFLLRCDFIVDAIASHESGASYPAVSDGNVLDCEIHLPPKLEQQKIAAVLWKMQRAIATQDRLIAATRDLKQSAMQRLFTHGLRGEPLKDTAIGQMPESWDVSHLSGVAHLARGRFTHRPRNEPRFYGGETPFVQTGDVVRSQGLITKYTQTLNAEGVAISRVFPKGTLLITIAANIGFTGILDFDSACPDSLVGITPNKTMDPSFLAYFLQLQQPEMDRQAPKGTQKNINIQFLQPWPVVVPHPDEQRDIAAALATIDRKLAHHLKKRAALNDLFQATLHQLMTAQIRVADLDIDTSEVADHLPGAGNMIGSSSQDHVADAGKMVGKRRKSATPDHFVDANKMIASKTREHRR